MCEAEMGLSCWFFQSPQSLTHSQYKSISYHIKTMEILIILFGYLSKCHLLTMISSVCHDISSITISPLSLTIYDICPRKLSRYIKEINRQFKDTNTRQMVWVLWKKKPHKDWWLSEAGEIFKSSNTNVWCNHRICWFQKSKNSFLTLTYSFRTSQLLKVAKCPAFVKDKWRFEATAVAREEICCFNKQHLPATLIPRQITPRQQHFSSGWV